MQRSVGVGLRRVSDLARDDEVPCCEGLADEIRFVNVTVTGN